MDTWDTYARLMKLADETNDRHDHDELHAAAAVVSNMSGKWEHVSYIRRWIEGLIKLHSKEKV